MRIGIDFDNTIARYDGLFAALAAEHGLLRAPPAGKRALRDALLARHGGEADWRRLQMLAYGPRMAAAELFDGVAEFLRAGRAAGCELMIVSHKTRHSNFEPDGTDLRQAARDWMEAKGFFRPDGFGLRPEDVYFEDTRPEKVARISMLSCDAFVDDLPEVFREPGFPAATRPVLFSPQADDGADDVPTRCRNWDEVRGALLG